MDPNALLANFTEQQVAAFFLVLARVSPLFILAPLFSSKSLPARARTIVALAITVGLMLGACTKCDVPTWPSSQPGAPASCHGDAPTR